MLTLAQIGEHLDLSAQAVMEFCRSKNIDWKDVSMDAMRVTYVRHLREIAAGRSASGDSALATERARLAREQADKVAMINARMRRELAPVGALESSLATTCRQIAAVLEALPVKIKRRLPDLPPEGLDVIAEEIVKVRNIAAAVKLELDEEEGHGSVRDPESCTADSDA